MACIVSGSGEVVPGLHVCKDKSSIVVSCLCNVGNETKCFFYLRFGFFDHFTFLSLVCVPDLFDLPFEFDACLFLGPFDFPCALSSARSFRLAGRWYFDGRSTPLRGGCLGVGSFMVACVWFVVGGLGLTSVGMPAVRS